MCVSHDMSEEMSTPRHFAEDTDSSMQLWNDLDLEELNSMSHL